MRQIPHSRVVSPVPRRHVKLNAVVAIELLDRRRKSFIVEHQAPLAHASSRSLSTLCTGSAVPEDSILTCWPAIRRSCARLRTRGCGPGGFGGVETTPFPSAALPASPASSFPGFLERSGVGGEHSYLASATVTTNAVSLAVDPKAVPTA